MNLHWADIVVFVVFFAVVIGVSMYQKPERNNRARTSSWPAAAWSGR